MTLSYETAKKLKDAGFPQRKRCLCTEEICVHLNEPTLEELIEACKAIGKTLIFSIESGFSDGHSGEWSSIAYYEYEDAQGEIRKCLADGENEIEAVAMLYIRLHA